MKCNKPDPLQEFSQIMQQCESLKIDGNIDMPIQNICDEALIKLNEMEIKIHKLTEYKENITHENNIHIQNVEYLQKILYQLHLLLGIDIQIFEDDFNILVEWYKPKFDDIEYKCKIYYKLKELLQNIIDILKIDTINTDEIIKKQTDVRKEIMDLKEKNTTLIENINTLEDENTKLIDDNKKLYKDIENFENDSDILQNEQDEQNTSIYILRQRYDNQISVLNEKVDTYNNMYNNQKNKFDINLSDNSIYIKRIYRRRYLSKQFMNWRRVLQRIQTVNTLYIAYKRIKQNKIFFHWLRLYRYKKLLIKYGISLSTPSQNSINKQFEQTKEDILPKEMILSQLGTPQKVLLQLDSPKEEISSSIPSQDISSPFLHKSPLALSPRSKKELHDSVIRLRSLLINDMPLAK